MTLQMDGWWVQFGMHKMILLYELRVERYVCFYETTKQTPQNGSLLDLSQFGFIQSNRLHLFSIWNRNKTIKKINLPSNTPWSLRFSTQKFNGSCSTLWPYNSV